MSILRLNPPAHGIAEETDLTADRKPALLQNPVSRRRWPSVTASVVIHGTVAVLMLFVRDILNQRASFPDHVRVVIRPVVLQVSDPARMRTMQHALASHHTLPSSSPSDSSNEQPSLPSHSEGLGRVGKARALVVPPAPRTFPEEAPIMLDKPSIDLPPGAGNALASAVNMAAMLTAGKLPAAPTDAASVPVTALSAISQPGVTSAEPPQGGIYAIFALLPPALAHDHIAHSPGATVTTKSGRRMEHPPDGKFDVVIVQPSLPDDVP